MGDPNDPDKKAANYTIALLKEQSAWVRSQEKSGNFAMNDHDAWAKSLVASHGVAPHSQDGVSSCYRCPLPGEPVTITGMCRRSDINGARGEVVDNNADERGRICVRVFNDGLDANKGSKKMKIALRSLVPARGYLPKLSTSRPPLPDEYGSCVSMSRAGSNANSSASRGRGSGVSGGGRSGYEGNHSSSFGSQGIRADMEIINEEMPAKMSMRQSASEPSLRRVKDKDRLSGMLSRALGTSASVGIDQASS